MSDYRSLYANSHALIVGINTYTDPRFVPLGQAESDAQAMAALLGAPPYSFGVTLLLGAQATKTAILKALHQLRRAKPDDRLLIYFAGHGYTLSDRNGSETGYLACADTIPDEDFTALELQDVIDLTRHTEAKHIGFIFDACFSGQALGLTRATAVSADKYLTRRAYQVISAGAGDQTVADYRSMTGSLIDALHGGIPQRDGLLTLSELGLHLRDVIASDSHHTQIPQFGHLRGSQGGEFVFSLDESAQPAANLHGAPSTPRLAAASGPAASRANKGWLTVKTIGLIALLAVIGIGLSVASAQLNYQFQVDYLNNELARDLEAATSRAASDIDADEMESLLNDLYDNEACQSGEGFFPDDERYLRHVAALNSVKDFDPRAQAFTMVAGTQANELILLGDSLAYEDQDRAAPFCKKLDMEADQVDVISQALFHFTTFLDPYNDDYGTWVSGYGPVRNSQGRVIGMVGVEFEASELTAAKNRARETISISTLPFCAGYGLIFGVIGFLLLRNRH